MPKRTGRKELVTMRNILEDVVKIRAKEVIKELGCCDCETCYFDVCALALNSLKAKYVTSNEGEILSEFSATEPNNKAEILAEITKAVMKVMERPRHEVK